MRVDRPFGYDAGTETFWLVNKPKILYTEIDRLPRPFRLAVVLCYFEGLTLEQAARRLRCPAGTVRSRLARAYDKLRRGLTRRGVALSAAAIATVLSSRSASASFVSSSLCETTARAAIQYAGRKAATVAISSSVVALARDVLRSMLISKLRNIAFALLLLSSLAAGAGFVAQAIARQAGKPDLHPSAAQTDDANPRPAPGRMFVVGRVLDPQGTPVPDAAIMIYAANRILSRDPYDGLNLLTLGRASSDSVGRFQIDAARTWSSRHFRAGAVALAPGYGAAWIDLDPDAERPGADIMLRPEQVISGHLVDLNGQPARGVTVVVQSMGLATERRRGYRVIETAEGPYFWHPHQSQIPAWPRPVKTDADGRYTVRGVGRGIRVFLGTDDPRFARSRFTIDTSATEVQKSVTTAHRARETDHRPGHGCRYRQTHSARQALDLLHLRGRPSSDIQRIRRRLRGPLPCQSALSESLFRCSLRPRGRALSEHSSRR